MRPRRSTWILLASVVLSALAVVYVRHEARRGFIELQALENGRDQVVTDWGRLQLEYATWASGGRVESLAKDELGLREVEPKQVIVVLE
ncbi:MAG: cell division protein FtsL [Xanthomonadales bacterium]|nr:cell division protein FtsL [Xanthomonadales bacterium]